MRRILRLFSFVTISIIFLAVGIFARPFLIFSSEQARNRFSARGTQIWARLVMRLLNMNIVIRGLKPEHLDNHYLFVSNHQSYLDIAIIASIFPTLFVAKREVRNWPILGWLAKLAGTIFINREDVRSGVSSAFRASRLLRIGTSVQVFPESTTSDGTSVLPFKPLFFASAIRARAPILPVTIYFQAINGSEVNGTSRDLLCWYGEMNFLTHFWTLLNLDSVEVSLMIHGPIEPAGHRRATPLAQIAEERIRNIKSERVRE
jgi:1-acyl-sn-glycerol-3-phosphate acyltransferase